MSPGRIDWDAAADDAHPLQRPALPPAQPHRHWAAGLIGLPWEPGAAGPRAYDCWGLVCAVLAVRCGVHMPLLLPPGPMPADGLDQLQGNPISGADETHAERVLDVCRADGWRRLPSLHVPAEYDVLFARLPTGVRHVGVLVGVNNALGVLHAGGGPSRIRPGAGPAGWGAVRFDRVNDLIADGVHTLSLWRHPAVAASQSPPSTRHRS